MQRFDAIHSVHDTILFFNKLSSQIDHNLISVTFSNSSFSSPFYQITLLFIEDNLLNNQRLIAAFAECFDLVCYFLTVFIFRPPKAKMLPLLRFELTSGHRQNFAVVCISFFLLTFFSPELYSIRPQMPLCAWRNRLTMHLYISSKMIILIGKRVSLLHKNKGVHLFLRIELRTWISMIRVTRKHLWFKVRNILASWGRLHSHVPLNGKHITAANNSYQHYPWKPGREIVPSWWIRSYLLNTVSRKRLRINEMICKVMASHGTLKLFWWSMCLWAPRFTKAETKGRSSP